MSSVRTQLLPRGGNMQMRLDPPELGALTISLKLIDGRMTASFTAENDDATRMLSQNLGQLKSTLEASGVQVQRIDVKTATEANTNSNSRDEGSKDQQKQSDGSWQQSEQQRREMVNKMWRRYAYGADELDLVA
ncbi:MAG TPA: flagellar hook-length control protein FliK [Tepidisphaeraceae bacterium]|nr:flagellar hook-length control protein FliK [Tepidisphaeraceae bacterium]